MAPRRTLSLEEKEVCKQYASPRPFAWLAAAILDHSVIFASSVFVVALWNGSSAFWAVAGYLITLPFVLRAMRGLECLVHDASHLSLSRRHRLLNDVLANLLAAFPTLSTVQRYRASHSLHHEQFNTPADVDKHRHRDHDFHGLKRRPVLELVRGLLVRYRRYLPGWWKAIGSNGLTLSAFAGWHFVFVGLLASRLGWPPVVAGWVVTWFVPFFFFLPMLRMFGEAGEHDYSIDGGSWEATYTNTRWLHRWLIYPHNDWLHTLHHMYPWIPHCSLRRAQGDLASRFPGLWANLPLER